MTEFLAGGRRRVDRVLAPGFLDNLVDLTLDEVRARRVDADQEEIDLSYARRLLQGRIDILRAEQEARQGNSSLLDAPRTDVEIVGALSQILADEPRPAHGLGRHLGSATPSRIGEHRREAERAVSDVGGSDLRAMSDVVLAEAIDHLAEIETRVSRTRRAVQIVTDSLAAEIARRYATGEIEVVLR